MASQTMVSKEQASKTMLELVQLLINVKGTDKFERYKLIGSSFEDKGVRQFVGKAFEKAERLRPLPIEGRRWEECQK